jgi:exonuclease SbcD
VSEHRLYKFAHISDIHLGAFREPVLQKMELEALDSCVETCIDQSVDFVLVAGDIFHVSIPDLAVVNESIRKFRKLAEHEIPIYVIYGSHDYTPNGTSIIDILDTAGVLNNIVKYKMEDGKLELSFVADKKTGAKITGLSARKLGLESKYYEILDREKLEREDGFRIFAFHSGITELKPDFLSEMETVPISYFPKEFPYYAGGHIHERGEFQLRGYPKIVFPGPLFTGYGKDIEDTARGTKRGFYLVSFDSKKVAEAKFQEIKSFDGAHFEYDATEKNSHEAGREIEQRLSNLNVKEKVVILRFKGELAGGKTTDIDFAGIRKKLFERGALYIYVNRYGLTSKESSSNRVSGDDPPIIEANLFKENIGAVQVSQKELRGEAGSNLALRLLKVMREKQKSGEQKGEYEHRIFDDALTTLNIKGEFEFGDDAQ